MHVPFSPVHGRQQAEGLVVNAGSFALARTCDVERRDSVFAQPGKRTVHDIVCHASIEGHDQVGLREPLCERLSCQTAAFQFAQVGDQRAVAVLDVSPWPPSASSVSW